MDSHLSRRNFLICTAGGAAALAATACSKSANVIRVPNNGAPQLSLLVTSGAVDGSSDQAVSVFEAGMDQRIAFVLTNKSGFLSPASIGLQFAGADKRFARGTNTLVEVHSDTGATAGTYFVSGYRFPSPGTYWLRATVEGDTAEAPVVVIDPTTAKIPFAGQKLISTPTPTDSDHRGVNPICTRTTECPFHTLSLDQASTKDMPIALMFGTPALCETATCGPVLDSLVAAAAPFAGKINFVHCEIFTQLSRNSANTAAVLAYHLQSEPILFLADHTGRVVERIDGLFGRAELSAALSRLAG